MNHLDNELCIKVIIVFLAINFLLSIYQIKFRKLKGININNL